MEVLLTSRYVHGGDAWTARWVVRITPRLRTALEAAAAANGRLLSDELRDAFRSHVDGSHEPLDDLPPDPGPCSMEVSIVMPPALFEQLRAVAARTGRPVSVEMRLALRRHAAAGAPVTSPALWEGNQLSLTG